MLQLRSLVLGSRVLGLCLSLSCLAASQDAAAEHCKWRFDQAFNLLQNRNLRAIERGARTASELQAKAELEVDLVFGPPVAQCEEGGYSLFLERFERFTTAALRMRGEDRDTRLRIAMAVIRRGPETIEHTRASKEAALYNQMLSNVGAVAQENGNTPLMQELIAAIKMEGAPKTTQLPETAPPDPHSSRVYVPTIPLPAWAVVSIYEIEDHARRKEHEKIQGKIEAIINWMKTVTPQQ